jgi:hypothetical protein
VGNIEVILPVLQSFKCDNFLSLYKSVHGSEYRYKNRNLLIWLYFWVEMSVWSISIDCEGFFIRAFPVGRMDSRPTPSHFPNCLFLVVNFNCSSIEAYLWARECWELDFFVGHDSLGSQPAHPHHFQIFWTLWHDHKMLLFWTFQKK